MKIPKNVVNHKFLMKNGRMGKVVKKIQYSGEKPIYSIRAVGRTKLRNLYSYEVKSESLEKKVIMWFQPDEIKIMYKQMQYQDKDGKKVNGVSGKDVEHKRVKLYL